MLCAVAADPYLFFQAAAILCDLRDLHALAQTGREGRRLAERLYEDYWVARLEAVCLMPVCPAARPPRSECRAILAALRAHRRYRVAYTYLMPLEWPWPAALALPPRAFSLFYTYAGLGPPVRVSALTPCCVRDRHELYAVLQDLFLLHHIDEAEFGGTHNDHIWFFVIGYIHGFVVADPVAATRAISPGFRRVIRRQMETYLERSHAGFLAHAQTLQRAEAVRRWAAASPAAAAKKGRGAAAAAPLTGHRRGHESPA